MDTLKQALQRIRASLIIIRHNPVFLLYPLLSAILSLAIIGCVVWGAVIISYIPPSNSRTALIIALAALSLFVLNLVGIFISGTLFSLATSALEGEKVSLRAGLKNVWARRKPLFQWGLFTSIAFLALALVRFGLDKVLGIFGKGTERILSPLLGGILNLGWAFATYFAVPVIMNHPDTPLPTLKRSAGLFTRSWGENVTAEATFLFLVLLILSGMGVVTALVNFLIVTIYPAVPTIVFGIVYGILAGIPLATLFILAPSAKILFNASLYRYAETGDYVGPFTQEMIKTPFPPKKRFGLFR